jgi:hypothetical protein
MAVDTRSNYNDKNYIDPPEKSQEEEKKAGFPF